MSMQMHRPSYLRFGRTWGFFVGFLLMLYVMRGVILACVIPPLELVDENQHVAYIDFIARFGKSPVFSKAEIDPSMQRIMAAYPGFGEITYRVLWEHPETVSGLAAKSPIRPLYEAQHPPLYYWLMSPLYKLLGGANNIPRVVGVLRLINVAFSAIGLGTVLMWLGKVCPDRKHAAILALGVSLHPMFLLNADRVANDALAIMLGSFAIVWTLSLGSRKLPLQSMGIGALIGVAVMVKATSLMLLPFALFCILVLLLHKQIGWREFAISGLLMVAGTALFTQQYFRANLAQFGNITPMQEAVANHVNHARLSEFIAYAPFTLARIKAWTNAITWWTFNGGMWCCNKIIATRRLAQLYAALLWTGTAGLLVFKLFRRRFPGIPDVLREKLAGTRILVLGLAIFAGMSYHAIHSMVAWKGRVLTCPWYAEVGVPWFLIVLLSGTLPFARTKAGRLALLPALIAPGLFGWTELHCTAQKLIPYFASMPLSVAALHRIATMQPSWLGMPTEFIAFATVILLFGSIYASQVRGLLRRGW